MDNTQSSTERDEKRRAVLESLHVQDVHPGRLVAGLNQSDRVLVASFNNPAVGQRFKRELAALGIPSWLRPDGLKTAVEVAYRDRTIAFERCAEFRQREPDEIPTTLRRPYDFAIFGGVLGAIVGVVSISFEFPILLFVWLGFVVNGAFMGYVLDPARRRRRSGVAGQFSIVDLLLLTAAVGVLFASIKFMLGATTQLIN